MKIFVWWKNIEVEICDICFKVGGLKLEGNVRNIKREWGKVFLLFID